MLAMWEGSPSGGDLQEGGDRTIYAQVLDRAMDKAISSKVTIYKSVVGNRYPALKSYPDGSVSYLSKGKTDTSATDVAASSDTAGEADSSVSDMTGTRKHNMTSNIYKIRLDQKGRSVDLAQEKQIMPQFAHDAEYGDLPESDAVVTVLDEQSFEPFFKQHHYVAVAFYAPCGSFASSNSSLTPTTSSNSTTSTTSADNSKLCAKPRVVVTESGDNAIVREVVTVPMNDFGDIYADKDGFVIVGTRDAEGGGTLNYGNPSNLCGTAPSQAVPCYDMYMARYEGASEMWATKLTSSSASLPPYSAPTSNLTCSSVFGNDATSVAPGGVSVADLKLTSAWRILFGKTDND
ncbi:hypothetical protein PF006_g11162 [Phytophthora fragariae]|uniref:Uncharacterized protein n=1 Tax=Phytophthora fragariae TaxID=53985 RepID=A0A6A3F7U7_9STRA|nr:hypothetical protein PF009_g10307 [Phytophthora fragariae]KAE9143839.1 hypothetical protein PF006_g11162 [Phytophthora fragariae]